MFSLRQWETPTIEFNGFTLEYFGLTQKVIISRSHSHLYLFSEWYKKYKLQSSMVLLVIDWVLRDTTKTNDGRIVGEVVAGQCQIRRVECTEECYLEQKIVPRRNK